MYKLLLVAALLLCPFLRYGHAQDFDLIGLIDRKIALVDTTTGAIVSFNDIPDMPGSVFKNLTYNSQTGLYYSILSGIDRPALVSISPTGQYQVIAQITLNGVQVPMVEAIAYNEANGEMYLGASLNGAVAQGDSGSESILTVNPLNGQCTFVVDIFSNESPALPDIDLMGTYNNHLYYYDGTPGGNIAWWYDLDLATVQNGASQPVTGTLMKTTTFFQIRDFAVTPEAIYATENRNLWRFDLATTDLTLQGPTHTAAQFGGQIIQGLSLSNLPCRAPQAILSNEELLCVEVPVTFDVTSPGATYLWHDGSTQPTFDANVSETIWVTVTSNCGSATDTLQFIIGQGGVEEIDLGDDMVVCDGSPVVLDVSGSAGTVTWQNGSNATTFTVTTTGTYFVSVEGICGIARDTITVTYLTLPTVNLGPDSTYCNVASVLLDATFPGAKYLWTDGSTGPTLTASQTSGYGVTVTNECGSTDDFLQLTFPGTPVVDLGPDLDVQCVDTSVVLRNSFAGQWQYLWQDGSAGASFFAEQSGTYWVTATNACGVATDTVSLSFPVNVPTFVPNVFTPNGDAFNETFQVSADLEGAWLKVFLRTGKMVYESKNYDNSWAGGNVASGTYFYLIEDSCGNSYKGTVHVLH